MYLGIFTDVNDYRKRKRIYKMNVVSIEPTPNPNSMKINLDEKLDPGKKYTFTKKDKERCLVQFKDILDIDGVISIFRVADFLTVQRHPRA